MVRKYFREKPLPFRKRKLSETLHKCVICGVDYEGIPRKIYCNGCKSHAYKLTVTKYICSRRLKEKTIKHEFSTDAWIDKLKSTKGFCPGYKIPPHFVGIENLSLDHVIPISKVEEGHIYTINDVNPLCRSCNSRKSNIF